MDRKKLILLVGALLIAAVTAFFARSMFTGAGAPVANAQIVAQRPAGPEILVATKGLPLGTIITAESLRYQAWPEELVEQDYFVKGGKEQPTMEQLVGTVVRNAITAGQPVTQQSLVAPGDRGFLAAALGPGMRAVTVPVSALTGVAGFIFPGDRVDLVLTQNITATDGPALKATETIVRNLRVLATDQNIAPTVDKTGKTVISKYKLVTLEATPRIAEKITVAQSIGTISLSLRSLADNAAELEQALASGTVTIPAGASQEEEDRILKSMAQSPTAGKGSYVTGGDVSRFQRSSVPAQMGIQVAAEQARADKQIEKIKKGPIVRVSRGGSAPQEVEVDRR